MTTDLFSERARINTEINLYLKFIAVIKEHEEELSLSLRQLDKEEKFCEGGGWYTTTDTYEEKKKVIEERLYSVDLSLLKKQFNKKLHELYLLRKEINQDDEVD